MKTTVEIPDEVFRAWKKRAVESGSTLKDMWESVLRSALQAPHPKPRSKRKIRWVTAKGGLPPGLDVSNRERMYDWIRRQK